MGITLTSYAHARHREHEKQRKTGGPAVTISREFGCPAKPITKELIAVINKTHQNKWKWVSKEIMHESAKELGTPPSELKYFFKYHEQGMLDGILNTQSKFYISDRKVYKTIRKVIKTIGLSGNTIIVGRGGAAICHEIENSLHIRLIAPLEWRTKMVMEFYHLDRMKAIEFIKDYDQKRKRFMEHYIKTDNKQAIFDVIYNCSSISKQEIVKSVYSLIKDKGMLSN